MYKKIDRGDGQIELRENFKSPMVYLDHWALNDFSLDKVLRDKFVDVMNTKGGTFRLSVFNFIELSRQADASQVEAILNMINRILDCGLINIDPKVVITKENALISDPSLIFKVKNPSAEVEIVAAYIMSHDYPNEWHVSDIIRSVISELPTKAMLRSNSEFIQDMQRLIKVGRGDKQHLQKAKRRFKNLKKFGPKYQRPTREIFDMALDFVMRNIQMKMSEYSEWTDLFHLIVPVSYCDIVMVDKRWRSFITQTGYIYPDIAMVFDKKTQDDFFTAIETWEPEAGTPLTF
jgi:hypothetical protein